MDWGDVRDGFLNVFSYVSPLGHTGTKHVEELPEKLPTAIKGVTKAAASSDGGKKILLVAAAVAGVALLLKRN